MAKAVQGFLASQKCLSCLPHFSNNLCYFCNNSGVLTHQTQQLQGVNGEWRKKEREAHWSLAGGKGEALPGWCFLVSCQT